MAGGPDKGGRAAIVSGALLRLRIPILLIALALTAAAFAVLISEGLDLGLVRRMALPALVWGVGLYAVLLSSRFVVLALVAPVAAWAWWRAAIGMGGFFSGASPDDPAVLSVVLCGAVLAALQTQQSLLGVARGLDPLDAVRMTLSRSTVFAAAALAVAFGGAVALDYPNVAAIPAMALAAMIALVPCVLLPPLFVGVVPVREAHIARFNRTREWRERALSWFAVFSIPRWSYAAAGIAAVVAAIVYFDRSFPFLWQAMSLPALALAALTGLLAVAFGNWRNLLSCGAAAFAAMIFGAWCAVKLGAEIWQAAFHSLVFWGAGAALLYFMAFRLSHYRRNEPMVIACSRAVDETAGPAVLLSLGLVAAVLSGALVDALTPAAALVPVAQLAAALILFPSLAAALDDLFPRRRSLKELYRAR
ncbi:MAG: hypothetical protein ACT4OG_03395 [Alphaproteobacteria bacterium]